ncbi:hypothetical protein CLU79DRAFT_697224 [Phycomyces nitens]|nr:hypothetical protein CLU79DRAFT_697224 [Phycomyces nitens]
MATKPDYKIIINEDDGSSASSSAPPQTSSLVAPSIFTLSPGARAALPIVSYCFASILMTVTNKYVLSGYEFNMNFLLLTVQNVVTVTLLQSFKFFNLIKFRGFDRGEARKWMPIAASLVAMIYTGSKALQFLRIPIYTIFKNLTIILIAYGEVIWFGGAVTPIIMSSFGLMILSSIIAGWADISDTLSAIIELDTTLIGYFWMAANCFSSAAFVLYMRKRIKLTNFKDFDTVYYNNLLSIPLLIVPSLIFEDWSSENLARNFPADVREQMVYAMIFSGVSAFVMSYASAWCVRTTSSTTYSMVGALNKLPLAASGILFFGDPATFGNVTAIIIGFVAGLVYSYGKTVGSNKPKGYQPQSIPMSASSQTVHIDPSIILHPVAYQLLTMKNKDTASERRSFHFSSNAKQLQPIQTIKQRLTGIWATLTWPVVTKVLKADIAVTIALGMLMAKPIQKYADLGFVLASYAVEFVHPAKSYGSISEDIFYGSIMCTLATGWSLLGTYSASLVRDPEAIMRAQPQVCAILAVFMIVGIMALNLFRVKKLVILLETFDGVVQRQSNSFLKADDSKSPNKAAKQGPEPLTALYKTIDTQLLSLINTKRIARRETTYNWMAPNDISDLTKIVKKLRVPLQGIGLSKAMEENMKMTETKCQSSSTHVSRSSLHSSAQDNFETRKKKFIRSAINSETDESENDNPYKDTESVHSPERKQPQVEFIWKKEYDSLVESVKPIYLELTKACAIATKETSKRLLRIQNIDLRFQDKPFFYRYIPKYKDINGADLEYDRTVDPSVALRKAIRRFDIRRLSGLKNFFDDKQCPRRILFLMLLFQFHIRSYSEKLFTISSLVYEIDVRREKRRLWFPKISLQKWLKGKPTCDEDYEMDVPAALADCSYLGLQRTLTQQSAMINSLDLENATVYEEPTSRQLFSQIRGNLSNGKKESSVALQSVQKSIWQTQMESPETYHDPDVSFPATRSQWFFYRFYLFFINNIYTTDALYALRAGIIVILLTIPAFIESSCDWYLDSRGQWSAVVAVIWMGPSVGSSFFGTMTRTVGTFIGAVTAIIAWEASRGSIPGLLILTFVFNLPWWFLYIKGQFWRATGLFALITISLIIGYAYTYIDVENGRSVFEISYQRTVAVIAGVVGAMFVSIVPYPRTGRVELRIRVAGTLGEIGALYSSFLALLLKNTQHDRKIQSLNRKIFRSVAATIRKQIKGERILLEQSRFEPSPRGVFQEEKYVQILQVLNNMLNLMIEMESSLEKINIQWRIELVKYTWKERKDLITSFLTAIHLAENALINKTPIPPYILRPTKARRNLTNKAREIPGLKPKRLHDPEFTYYSAYVMSSEQFAVELELLVATIRDLVGPDSVSLWLDYRH